MHLQSVQCPSRSGPAMTAAASRLWRRVGGVTDGPLLLLLHGLGANAEVFDAMVAAAQASWPGGWLVPDLPGHGRSGAAASYSFDGMATEVALLIPGDRRVVVVGHSMGGVVALALADGRHDVTIAGVVGVGIKVAWTDDELARAAALATRPPKAFAAREECAARFLKVAGLEGLASAGDAVVDAGITDSSDGWRLAMDPRCLAIGSPEMAARTSAAGCPVRLARGELDPMVTLGQLRDFDAQAIDLPGLGHNAHVEDPDAVLALALDLL